MQSIHKNISQYLPWYRKWHRRRFYAQLHWGIFFTVLFFFSGAFLLLIDAGSVDFPNAGVSAKEYFVDSEKGSDASSGLTREEAWKTLSMLSEKSFLPGEKIFLAGSFEETLAFSFSGRLAAPIKIIGTGNGAAVFGILLEGVSFLDIRNVEVSQNNKASDIKNSAHISITQSRFSENSGTVLSVADSSNIRIIDNDFVNNSGFAGDYLINFSNTNNLLFSENKLSNIIGNVLNIEGGDEVKILSNSFSSSTGNIIRSQKTKNLEVSQNIIEGFDHLSEEYAMDFYKIDEGILKGNSISGFRGMGAIRITDSRNVFVAANLLVGNQEEGIRVEKGDNISIFHNTVYGLGFWQTAKAIVIRESKKVKVFNNITMDILGYALDVDEYSAESIVSDSNNLTGAQGVAIWEGESFRILSEYAAASGQDKNSFSIDPKFENIFAKDFHLTSDSPLIDRGIDMGVGEDFDGAAIPQGVLPDIGAFEYIQNNN